MFEPLSPLITDTDLVAMATDMVGPARRRQTWLFVLDDEHRALPVVIPIDGIPVDPDPQHIATLAERLTELVDGLPEAERLVLVWERPGSPAARMQEVDWMLGLARSGAPIRAQLLASDDGVRVVDPAFEAIVSV